MASSSTGTTTEPVLWLADLDNSNVAQVGGKNASLGEMIGTLRSEGVKVPGGFATTAAAYREFLSENDLEQPIRERIDAFHADTASLEDTGQAIRRLITRASMPTALESAIREAYRRLAEQHGSRQLAVAVRSSATAEDLPDASFAGQQETFLNIRGVENVIEACQRCYASLFTDRAIAYREEQGFDHFAVALSVGVQRMVRSDKAGSGVMFSLDTETGFPDVVVIDAAWGLGETVVQGTVNPDEYRVFKPLLEQEQYAPIIEKTLGAKEHKMVYARGGDQPTRTVATTKKQQRTFVLDDDEILQLARWACAIERHYGRPMDMEWAKDGADGELTIIQARPETVQSQRSQRSFTAYTLRERGEAIARGLAIGESIASGPARCIDNPEDGDRVQPGDILVTGMTDPDWVPIMKRAAAIVTDHGGRTSHAAIVSRELGVAAAVGCNDATERIADGDTITVSCAEGDQGVIYRGELAYDEQEIVVEDLPRAPVDLMINIATPSAAFRWWRLPTSGVGLARMEFIINNQIKAHPLALTRFDQVTDADDRAAIEQLTAGYDDKTEYFVDHLARGIAAIASAQYPHPTVVRLSDFKSNEYAALLGGASFEPTEANPMLGFRGASRYYHENYRDGFALECRALKRAREQIGLDNIIVMVPFVRTLGEADRVLATMAENGLVRGENGLQIYVMCEIPANVLLAADFAQRFDGFSIGSNDLTQLTLGIDRDSDLLGPLFDERDPAVLKAIAMVIEQVQAHGCKIGICGQAPSDHPDFARFLVEHGIDSMSLNPDSVIEVLQALG